MMNNYEEIKVERVQLGDVDNYIERYQDDNGIYWYDYKAMCEKLFITYDKSREMYKYWLNDEEKQTFSVNICGDRFITLQFISTEGMGRVINRNNEHANNFMRTIIQSETSTDEYEELRNDINKIQQQMNCKDVLGAMQTIKDIYLSEDYMEAMDKYDKNYNKYNELMIDEYRGFVYDNNVEEIELNVKMYPREGINNYNIVYKKNPKCKENSTCPEWIRNVVK